MSAVVSALAALAQQAHDSQRPNPPHVSFVGAKTRPTSLMSNKNKPGRSEEHTDALAINAEFVPAPKTEIIEPTQTEFAPEPEPESPRLA